MVPPGLPSILESAHYRVADGSAFRRSMAPVSHFESLPTPDRYSSSHVSNSDSGFSRRAPVATSGGSYRIRIVVADDHPVFREGLCKLLTLEEDFEVVAQAQDGRQALEALQRYEPDILLLDLRMPELDGLTTLGRLHVAKARTRVIVLTASDDKNEFVQAMKLGSSGIVLKQAATDLLIESVRKVHAGEIWLDSHVTSAVIRQFVANDEPAAAPPARSREQESRRSSQGELERALLTVREREVVALVAQGFRNKEMAEKMFLSEQTVKNHLHNIFDKLGVSDRLELALYAIHYKLLTGR